MISLKIKDEATIVNNEPNIPQIKYKEDIPQIKEELFIPQEVYMIVEAEVYETVPIAWRTRSQLYISSNRLPVTFRKNYKNQ